MKFDYCSSVFIMPPKEEYQQHEYYKKHHEIPGDVYWQGRIVKLGCKKEDVAGAHKAAAAKLPKVSWMGFIFPIFK